MYVNEVGVVLRALGFTPPQAELDTIAAEAAQKSQSSLSFEVSFLDFWIVMLFGCCLLLNCQFWSFDHFLRIF